MLHQRNQRRRTKIIATLGPATDKTDKLFKLLDAGVDIVRLNLSHSDHKYHENNITRVKQWSKNNHQIGIIADLQGSKIRIGEIINSQIQIKENQLITIDPSLTIPGNDKIIGINYPQLASELNIDDILLLDDGLIKMQIMEFDQDKVICKIRNNGQLKSYKGVNKKGGGLLGINFTDKDKEDLAFALKHQVDFIALSFVKDQHDIINIKQMIKESNSNTYVIAKIERKESIENLTQIIESSDGVMVARGDLGLELGIDKVPLLQKLIISKTRALNKPVITATQMMESMITNPIPTRAEVSDIANAILDCTDAIMFTAETASGNHPDLVIKSAHKICLSSEEDPITSTSQHRIKNRFTKIDEAIAMASMYIANHQDIQAVICLTETGTTPLLMSRINSNIPIYAVSPDIAKVRIMSLYKNVYPIMFNYTIQQHISIEQVVIDELVKRNLLKKNIPILITSRELKSSLNQTSTLKMLHPK